MKREADDQDGATIDARWRMVTTVSASGSAIAMIVIWGDIDAACDALTISRLTIGRFGVRDFAGVDRGVAARWNQTVMHLMPHGGAAVLKRLEAWLLASGVRRAESLPLREDVWKQMPQARSEVDGLALWALGGAASPAAIPLLMAQHELWMGKDAGAKRTKEEEERDAILRRVLEPAVVLICGRANVGKSRLLNALAGTRASIVSEVAGTTRDHVGVQVLCGDVVVRLIDTPGARETEYGVEREAMEIAERLWSEADLVLWCGDVEHGFMELPREKFGKGVRVLMVGMKCDLGNAVKADGRAVEMQVSGETGEGVQKLAAAISEALVPQEVRDERRPWRFWGGMVAE